MQPERPVLRKTVGSPEEPARQSPRGPLERGWLDLAGLARIEISSEAPDHPIESALTEEHGPGWRAMSPGRQRLRILFDEPRPIRRVQLRFLELERERSQEFAIRWSPDGNTYRDVVRQQWNFSPEGSREELEDYELDLEGVRVLELLIDPDRNKGEAVASLARLRIA
jgi:hypothetical protein